MSLADTLVDEAQALEASGDLGAAHSKLEEAARLRADCDVLWRLGRSFMLMNQLSEAEGTLQQAISNCPQSAEAHFMLGFTRKRQNQLGTARELLERGLALQDWPAARVVLGEIYRQLGEPIAAREQLEAVLESDPSNSEGWYSLGLTYREHDPQTAVSCFRRAIEADSKSSAAYRELGFVLAESGDLHGAEQRLRVALALDPNDVWTHCYLGSVLKRLRRLSEAEAECRQTIKLNPDEPLFWCNLGDVLALEGKWDDAEQSYLSALSKDVSHYLANFRYGQFLSRRGYPAKAIGYLERALSADPENKRIAEVLVRARAKVSDA